MSLRSTTHYFQHRGNRRQTNPGLEIVELAELRRHLRLPLGDTESDEYLETLIEEAREEIEDRTGLAFISQTWKLTLDVWPGAKEPWWDGVREGPVTMIHGGHQNTIDIPRYPLISIDSMTVYDEDSNSTSVTVADTFDVDTNSQRGRLTLQRGATWPIATRSSNAIEIDYTAGYGTAVTDVPTPLVRAVRNMAGYLYTHRGTGCTPGEAYMKSGAAEIAERYRVAEL